MSSSDLAAASILDGDLLIAAEGGGGVTIRIRCATTCTVASIVPTATTTHIEGHLAIAVGRAASHPTSLGAGGFGVGARWSTVMRSGRRPWFVSGSAS
jgi:hypothetical protein